MKAMATGRVVRVAAVPRYEAPSPYRRSTRVLVDQELFPGTSMCVGLFTYPPGGKSPTHRHLSQNEIYFVQNRTRRRCVFLAVHAPTVPDLLAFKRGWKRRPARRT